MRTIILAVAMALLSGAAVADDEPAGKGVDLKTITDLHTARFPGGAKERSGDVTLVLHGFPAYSSKNEDIAERLARETRHDVVVVHYRGLGSSPGTFSFTGAVADTTRLAEGLIRMGYRRVNLVGHSFGAAVALLVADSVPQVAAVAVLAPLTRIPPADEVREDLAGFATNEATLGHAYTVDTLVADSDRLRAQYDSPAIMGRLEARRARLLVVVPKADDVIPPGSVRDWRDSLAVKPELLEFEADHWFTGKRMEVADAIARWLRGGRE